MKNNDSKKGDSCKLCSMGNMISTKRQKLAKLKITKDYKWYRLNFTSKNATWVIRDLVIAVGGRTVLVFAQFLPDFGSPRGFIIFSHHSHFGHSLKQISTSRFDLTF